MSERKTLAVISPHHWSGAYGGAEYQMKLLISEILRTHEELDIVYLCRDAATLITPDDYTIHPIAGDRWYSKYGTFFDAFKLYKMLKRLKPDYIYQRVGCAYTGIAAYYANKHNINMLWHIASDMDIRLDPNRLIFSKPHHWLEKKILEYGIKHVPRIVSQTKGQANTLKRNYGRSVDAIIANFQPVPEFTKNHDTRPHVVWIANHKVEKRPEVFIELAEALVKKTNAKFTMAGRPAAGAWGESVIERARNSDAVHYAGEMTQGAIMALLESAHIFVNTSEFEGFPNTFIQSWMREVLVLSLSVNPDEVITDNGIGIFSGDIPTLHKDALTLITDKEKRISIAKAGREYALKTHSFANVEAVIQQLTSKA